MEGGRGFNYSWNELVPDLQGSRTFPWVKASPWKQQARLSSVFLI